MTGAMNQAGGQPKLQIAKIVEGDIMSLRFIGTIDEDFDGKQMAETVKGTLILDLGQVRRISSFGIREWVDFIGAASEKCKAIYFVECSPKVMDQFNMVANFAGKGRVLSFYAPYRCDYCDDDRVRLVQVEDSWDDIQNMHLPDYPCESCGNPEYFDEDPQSFFNHLINQPKVEPDPAVANFLATKLNYTVSDAARRLRIEKHIGRATYIKLAGDLDADFPKNKIVEGLEGDVVFDVGSLGRIDDAGATVWANAMQEIAQTASRVMVRHATPGFIERLTTPEALAGKVEVLDLYMPFACSHCGTTAAQLVDVAEHFDVLKFATPPEMTCSDCGAKTDCVASEEFMAQVAGLPKPDLSSDLKKFFDEAEEIVNRPPVAAAQGPQAGLPSLGGGAAPMVAPARTMGLAALIAVVVSLVVVLGVGLMVWKYVQMKKTKLYDEAGTVVKQKAAKLPGWMKKAKTKSVWRDGGVLTVVGYSHSARDSEQARQLAVEDALESIVQEIADGVQNEDWKQAVMAQYKDVRSDSIERLKTAMTAKDADAVRKARKKVWEARRRVAKAFRATAYEVPKEGDDFWQKLKTSDGIRWRYWVIIQVDEKKIEGYRQHYTKLYKTQGVIVANYFPGLAWAYPTATAGAVVLKVDAGSPWRVPGLERGNLIVECRRQQIGSGKVFVESIDETTRLFKDSGGRVECKTLYGSVVRPVGYEIARKTQPRVHNGGRTYPHHRPATTFTGNVWDDPTK
ncbi:MAG: hypothetical protein J7M25_07805 [Deltaproteobacteria bacterium]|nr:hypothetical protein [Deltaproteobacteria bacterium]